MLQSFKELIIWQRAIDLVKAVYQVTGNFPRSELYTLTTQMRRAAISIPANIAEGYQRRNIREYLQFLCIADASAAELQTHIVIAKSIYPLLNFSVPEGLCKEVQKMFTALLKKLRLKQSIQLTP